MCFSCIFRSFERYSHLDPATEAERFDHCLLHTTSLPGADHGTLQIQWFWADLDDWSYWTFRLWVSSGLQLNRQACGEQYRNSDVLVGMKLGNAIRAQQEALQPLQSSDSMTKPGIYQGDSEGLANVYFSYEALEDQLNDAIGRERPVSGIKSRAGAHETFIALHLSLVFYCSEYVSIHSLADPSFNCAGLWTGLKHIYCVLFCAADNLN